MSLDRLKSVNAQKYEVFFDALFEDLDNDLQPHVMARIAVWHLERYFKYVGKTQSHIVLGALAKLCDEIHNPQTTH